MQKRKKLKWWSLGLLVGSLSVVTPIITTSCSSSKYETATFVSYQDNNYLLMGQTNKSGYVDIEIAFLTNVNLMDLTIDSSYTYNDVVYSVGDISVANTSFENVSIRNLIVIGSQSFSLNSQDKTYVSNIINISQLNTKKINICAFRNCTGLERIEISERTTTIGDYTFSNCSSLTSITIPNSVTSIGSSAFEKCTSLTSITIPKSFESSINEIFGDNITAEITYT